MGRNEAAVEEVDATEKEFQDPKAGVFVHPAETPHAGVDSQCGTKKTAYENENKQSSSTNMICVKEEDLRNQVFQNSIILHQIFTCFRTSFLLKRCSLVNKLWNREARTFIRDHRKCSACKPKSIDIECEFLQKLDQLCCQITEDGRVIPFNSLRMPTWWYKCEDLEESSASKCLQVEFKSELKMRYLEISWFMAQGNGDCSIHHSLVTLLRHSAPHLKKLKLETAAPQFEDLFTDRCFPQLEEIVIRRKCSSHEEQLTDRKILAKVLECAPKCRRIRINNLYTLYLSVPPEKYGLVTELECQGSLYDEKFEDENLFPKVMERIIEKKPALRKLLIRPPADIYFPYDSNDEQAVVAGMQETEKLIFKSVLHRLLQAFRQTLRSVSISGRLSFEQLSPPRLLNLTKLILKDDLTFGGDIEEFWTSIVSTDFEQIMPNLDELKIIIKTVSMNTSQETLDALSYVWPECDHIPDGNNYNVCTSIRKLTLEVEVRRIEFCRINIFFPNVKSLDLKIDFSYGLRSECLPISEISQAWPDLEEVNIHGRANFLSRNYDADFCGIHKEEAELLRSQDEEYLKAVQIVPVRPCLLTMSSLQFLRIALTFRATARDNSSSEEPLLLKSNGTDILAFKRMNRTDFSVTWEIENVDEYDDDDGDYDDEEEDNTSDDTYEVYEEDGGDRSEGDSEVDEEEGGPDVTETDDDGEDFSE